MQDPRINRLAEVLVKYSVNVKKGDIILLKGETGARPLLAAVYQQVLLAGGHPVLRMLLPEAEELMCKFAKDHQLSFLYSGDKNDFESANGLISVWAEENTKDLSNSDPAKQAKMSKARKPVLDLLLSRSALEGDEKFRWVGTQFPCPASAQDAEMSLGEYEEFVYSAGLLHLPDPAKAWKTIGKAQQRVCDYLNRAKEIRFVSDNGTDLRLGIEGRTWINCDGRNNFPDGEVFTGPIEDATEGEVRYSFPAVHDGREVTDVHLKFQAGKVVDASASRNEDFLYKMIDQDEGGRILGEVAIGTNYAVQKYTKNTLFDEKIGGTFHAALGAAYPESGGKNVSALHWDMVCDLRQGGRIEVDGKVISKNGRFLNSSWPKPVGVSRKRG